MVPAILANIRAGQGLIQRCSHLAALAWPGLMLGLVFWLGADVIGPAAPATIRGQDSICPIVHPGPGPIVRPANCHVPI